jgi:hypothetical protein
VDIGGQQVISQYGSSRLQGDRGSKKNGKN